MSPPLPLSHGRRLSEDLAALPNLAKDGKMTVERLMRVVRGRGFPAVLAVLALPFVVPVLPGLSTPFGLAILIFGLHQALLRRPMLPRWLLRREVPEAAVRLLAQYGVPVIRRAERWLHPRLPALLCWPIFRSLTGLAVASCGFILTLPLPIPFSNTLPALGALLLAVGAMEEDGVFILLGWIVSLAAWAGLAILVWMGKFGLHHFLFRNGV